MGMDRQKMGLMRRPELAGLPISAWVCRYGLGFVDLGLGLLISTWVWICSTISAWARVCADLGVVVESWM
jgi:hypothetical protein